MTAVATHTTEPELDDYNHDQPDPPDAGTLNPRVWRKRVALRNHLADRLAEFSDEHDTAQGSEAHELAEKLNGCGNVSWFSSCSKGHGHAVLTSTCKSKLCPVCAAKTSAKRTHAILERTPDGDLKNFVSILLTTRHGNLDEKIAEMKTACTKFFRLKRIRENYPARLYTLEYIPSKSDPDLWHVHAHVLAVSRSFIPQPELLKMWNSVSGGEYVWIGYASRRFSSTGKQLSARGAVIETLKYITKVSQLSVDKVLDVNRTTKIRRYMVGGYWSRRTEDERCKEKLYALVKKQHVSFWKNWYQHPDSSMRCSCGDPISVTENGHGPRLLTPGDRPLTSHALGHGLQPNDRLHEALVFLRSSLHPLCPNQTYNTVALSLAVLLEYVYDDDYILSDPQITELAMLFHPSLAHPLLNSRTWFHESPLQRLKDTLAGLSPLPPP